MKNFQEKISNKMIFMTREDLRAVKIEYSNTHLLRLERAGRFPQRIRLSASRVVWDYNEVMTFIRQKMDERAEVGHD